MVDEEPDPFANAEDGHDIPAAVGSERAILGELLTHPKALVGVVKRLAPEDFFRVAHQDLFAVIVAVGNANPEGYDVEMVAAAAAKSGNRALTPMFLFELVQLVTASLDWHIARVKGAAQARRIIEHATRIAQMAREGYEDTEEMTVAVAREHVALELAIEERPDDRPIDQLSTWDTFLAEPDLPQDWVVRFLLEREDVLMILAGEGDGKSWLARQLALLIAAGIHPWKWDEEIPPMRTLLIDPENAPTMLRRQSRPLHSQVVRHIPEGAWSPDNALVWRKSDGFDLRRPADQRLFERAVEEHRPDALFVGSLYKCFQRRGDDWDTAAAEVRDVFDGIRRRYHCAIVVEHHMAKGDPRPKEPYGSSEWMRWCSMGRVMTQLGANAWRFDSGNFRKDRDIREWPIGLRRGGDFPWSPIFDEDELEHWADDPRAPQRRGNR